MINIKSPMNYTGGKFKLLPQILPLFPSDIDVFVDLFCGGLDVSVNTDAKIKICNDLETHIIDFYTNIKPLTGAEVHKKILGVVEEYDLSKENMENYLRLRTDYNLNNVWYLFYTLLCYSFNNQIRFNKSGGFNMPFGKNRSCYCLSLQEKLVEFVDTLTTDYTFTNLNFSDVDMSMLTPNSFVYADPPYLISTATYTEGKQWTEKEEVALLELLDNLNERGIKWGLSNVLELNGKKNEILKTWSDKYTVHMLNFDYSNSSYHKKDKSKKNTVEVYICNYT